ncbi:MAG TPA: hypothetical protein VI700_01090, partial [Thermoanaerobaculaceae bacterium]|nr:hypothetical protein [Thermoanaerobaculaceae bacterium]
GGTGYGEMKKRLLGLILETFREARLRREELERDRTYVEEVIRRGRERAGKVIGQVMAHCRRVCGLGWV